MKKLLSLFASLVAGQMLYAMPVLNPAAPALLTDGTFACDESKCWGVKFGYRGDFVFNKHMRGEARHIDGFSLYANEGVLTINFWDRLDVYGFVGAASLGINSLEQDAVFASPATIDSLSAKYNTRTIGGLGVKAVLFETCWTPCATTYVGLDAQYEWLGSAPLGSVTIQGVNVSPNNSKRQYKEAQVALGLSHKISNMLPTDLVPYAALVWSKGRSKVGGSPIGVSVPRESGESVITSTYDSQRQWGYVVGVSLVDAGRMSVSAEARFIYETAVSVSGEIRF